MNQRCAHAWVYLYGLEDLFLWRGLLRETCEIFPFIDSEPCDNPNFLCTCRRPYFWTRETSSHLSKSSRLNMSSPPNPELFFIRWYSSRDVAPAWPFGTDLRSLVIRHSRRHFCNTTRKATCVFRSIFLWQFFKTIKLRKQNFTPTSKTFFQTQLCRKVLNLHLKVQDHKRKWKFLFS